MVIQNYSEQKPEKRAPVGVWFCDGCQCFHVKAGAVLLTFDRDEFADFSDSVFDCYSTNVKLADFSTVH